MRKIFLILCLVWLNGFLWAQDSTGLSVSAYVDTYYAYDFNQPLDGNRQYANMVARHNEFNLNHVFLMGSYQGSKLRGELGIQAGTYPDVNYSNEPSDLYKLIYKANVGVKVGQKTWIDAGVFEGHFGYEVVESVMSEIYSKSIPAEYTPYYESGVRATIDISEKWELYITVLNGWQNIAETNKTKAIGFDVKFSPNDKIEVNYGNYFGNEGDRDIGDKFRMHHEGYFKYKVSPKLHAVVTFDVGTQEEWNGTTTRPYYFFTLISQYYLSDMFSVSGRIEHNNDQYQILVDTNSPDGFVGQVYTANFNYHITSNSMLRIEGKYYSTQNDIFNAGEIASSNNALVAVSLAAKFN